MKGLLGVLVEMVHTVLFDDFSLIRVDLDLNLIALFTLTSSESLLTRMNRRHKLWATIVAEGHRSNRLSRIHCQHVL